MILALLYTILGAMLAIPLAIAGHPGASWVMATVLGSFATIILLDSLR